MRFFLSSDVSPLPINNSFFEYCPLGINYDKQNYKARERPICMASSVFPAQTYRPSGVALEQTFNSGIINGKTRYS